MTLSALCAQRHAHDHTGIVAHYANNSQTLHSNWPCHGIDLVRPFASSNNAAPRGVTLMEENVTLPVGAALLPPVPLVIDSPRAHSVLQARKQQQQKKLQPQPQPEEDQAYDELPTVTESIFNVHSTTSADLNNYSSTPTTSASSSANEAAEKAAAASASADQSTASGDHNAVLLLPGFASTQLYNWRFKDCFPFSYNLADRCVTGNCSDILDCVHRQQTDAPRMLDCAECGLM
jgi:hypothetical protein